MRPVLIALALALAPAAAHAGSATLTKAPDGHYWAEAKINGRPVKALIDTGASLVALTPADAKRVGINPRKLSYDHQVLTAAGPAHAARVTLDSVAVGGARAGRVEAMVIPKGLDVTLLGMSYFSQLRRMDVRGDKMRLED